MKRILIINGPNLDKLGTREPQVYGDRTFEEYTAQLRQAYPKVHITVMHSNLEGELINALHEGAKQNDGVVINPAGYSHTSVALRDAISMLDIPVIEVHISNLHAREEFRHNSLTGAVCSGVISGFGLEGYALAIHQLLQRS